MAKRSSTTSDRATKLAKVDPVDQECGVVSRALGRAGLAPSTLHMFRSTMDVTLALAKAERHVYQTEMVEQMQNVLTGVSQELEERITGTNATIAEFDATNVGLTRAVEAAASDVAAKEQAYTETRRMLANAATRYYEAKEAHEETVAAQEVGEGKLVSAQKDLETLESGMTERLEPLKQGTLAEGKNAHYEAVVLLKQWKNMNFEDALTQAVVGALSQAPAEREAFQQLAIKSLDGALVQRVASLKDVLVHGDATKKKLADCVAAAENAFKQAKAEQIAKAETFEAAQLAKEQAEHAEAAAEDAVRNLAKELKKAQKTLESTQTKLTVFQEGPWAAFVELRDRELPPPPVEEQPAEEPTTAAEAAEDAPPEEAAPAGQVDEIPVVGSAADATAE